MVDWRLDGMAPGIAEVDRQVPPQQRRRAGWLDGVSDAAVRKRLEKQAEESDKLERMRVIVVGRQAGGAGAYNPPSTARSPSAYYPPSPSTSASSSPTMAQSPYRDFSYDDPVAPQEHEAGAAFETTKRARKELRRQRKDAEKEAKSQRKREEKAAKAGRKEGKKAEFKVGMADRMEERSGGSLLWLVVVNLEDDELGDEAEAEVGQVAAQVGAGSGVTTARFSGGRERTSGVASGRGMYGDGTDNKW